MFVRGRLHAQHACLASRPYERSARHTCFIVVNLKRRSEREMLGGRPEPVNHVEPRLLEQHARPQWSRTGSWCLMARKAVVAISRRTGHPKAARHANAPRNQSTGIIISRPSDRRGSGNDPKPQCAFKMSMFNVSCNSH